MRQALRDLPVPVQIRKIFGARTRARYTGRPNDERPTSLSSRRSLAASILEVLDRCLVVAGGSPRPRRSRRTPASGRLGAWASLRCPSSRLQPQDPTTTSLRRAASLARASPHLSVSSPNSSVRSASTCLSTTIGTDPFRTRVVEPTDVTPAERSLGRAPVEQFALPLGKAPCPAGRGINAADSVAIWVSDQRVSRRTARSSPSSEVGIPDDHEPGRRKAPRM